MGSIDSRPLKAFVRFDGSGRIVAGSLVLRKNKPKVGKWREILAYECCNYIPTTSSTTTINPALCDTLGRAAGFSVLGHTTVTNTGPTVVSGDLGLSPGTSVTGFPPGIVLGTQHITDTAAANAKIDAQAAYLALNFLPAMPLMASDLGGLTINPGFYLPISSSIGITGTVTLDGGGNPNAVFVFQIASTFIPAVGSTIALTNGTQAGNIYWVVGSSATLSVGSTVKGNIIAQASVAIQTNASLEGRAIALTGAVTMDSNAVTITPCTINPLV